MITVKTDDSVNVFEQNVETLRKTLSIIGYKKELPESKIGKNKSKID